MLPEWTNALVGGALIGIAVSLMLLWNGRIAGVSGILSGLFSAENSDRGWRVSFIVGLLMGGVILKLFSPDVFFNSLSIPMIVIIAAGLLVGFGTAMGSGCTSGHGVCGISRLSVRSIVATIVFILSGVAIVALFRNIGAAI